MINDNEIREFRLNIQSWNIANNSTDIDFFIFSSGEDFKSLKVIFIIHQRHTIKILSHSKMAF